MTHNFFSFPQNILKFLLNHLDPGKVFMHPDPELGKTQGKEKIFGFFDFLK